MELQDKKASFPIDSNDSGNSNVFKDLHETNALSPMDFMVLGRDISVNTELAVNVSGAIPTTVNILPSELVISSGISA